MTGAVIAICVAAMLLSPEAAMGQATPAADDWPVLTEGARFFVDPASNARRQADAWRESRPVDAAAMDRVATQPQADWFGDWVPDIRAGVDARVTEIVVAGALPVLVAYNIPFRDCGQYSAGGTNDPESYRRWIDGFAAGIGDRPAVVILEPDGLALTDCLDATGEAERFALLASAVDAFAALPEVDVYIDAGHSDWLPADEAARRLTLAGIDRAAGFALNVSNFQWTDDLIAYGRAISDAIGADDGTHFVLDTSRNGNGPWQADDPETWCNPPGRALGAAPTVDTADPLVDAYLWIKAPGESDGACRDAPEAGAWYPEYALELARNAGGPAASPAASPAVAATPASCDATAIHTEPWPGADPGLAGIPWVEAGPAGSGIIGHLWYGDRPLHTGGSFPDGTNAKVLWTFERPVRDLALTATPAVGDGSAVLNEPAPAYAYDDGSSTTWPSIIDVPTAGCWRLALDASGIDGQPVHGTVILFAVA